VQSNFVMQNCGLLVPHGRLVANQTTTLNFEAQGNSGSEQIAVPAARIILTR
jgi:hypothetical protein